MTHQESDNPSVEIEVGEIVQTNEAEQLAAARADAFAGELGRNWGLVLGFVIVLAGFGVAMIFWPQATGRHRGAARHRAARHRAARQRPVLHHRQLHPPRPSDPRPGAHGHLGRAEPDPRCGGPERHRRGGLRSLP